MKIFLDVGAHIGETARPALDPKYAFDRIYSFEPVESCRRELSKIRDRRLTVLPFGLWRETCERPIYDPGSVGASIFKDKQGVEAHEMIALVRASDWFHDHVATDDRVFVKLNCEGSESDVLEDLIDSGEIRKVDCAMIAFDVRKVPSQRHREAEVCAKLEHAGVAWTDSESLPWHNRFEHLQMWLDTVGAGRGVRMPASARVRSWSLRARHRAVPAISRLTRLGRLGRRLLPRKVHARVQRFFYPESGGPVTPRSGS